MPKYKVLLIYKPDDRQCKLPVCVTYLFWQASLLFQLVRRCRNYLEIAN